MLKLTKNEFATIVRETLQRFQRDTWDHTFDEKPGEFASGMTSGDKKLVSGVFDLWIAAIQRLKEMLNDVDFGK